MQTKDKLEARGQLRIIVTAPDGSVREDRTEENLVVSSGLNFIVSRMKDTTQAAMSHMELGTGTTAAALANTALETPIASSRVALTSTIVSTNTITYSATFGAGVGTGAVTEAGVFNNSTAGTMLCRTVFPVVNKQAADSMSVTWTITVT
jgi:hypothetical protein